MQIFIDTNEESTPAMRRVAQSLLDLAFDRDGLRADVVLTEEATNEAFRRMQAAKVETPLERADANCFAASARAVAEAPAPTLDPRVVFAQTGTAVIPPEALAAQARIAAGGLGQGPTSFEALQPMAPNEPKPADTVTVIPPPPPTSIAPQGGPVLAMTISSVGPVYDRDGLPHDRRIHSETPTIKADGRWRARRNLDNATLVAVEAELRAQGGTYPPASPPAQVIPPPPPPVVPAGTVAPSQSTPVIPPPPPAVLPATETTIAPFRKLMAFVGPYTGVGGPLEASKMKAVHAEFGATGWQDYVAKCEPQIPALMERLKGMVS